MEAVLEDLKQLNVAFTEYEHPAVTTAEDLEMHIGSLPGAHTKNLLVSDKKHGYYLLTVLTDRRVDMKALAKALDLSGANFRFVDKKRLPDLLGVEQGAVSPLALSKDTEGKICLVIEEAIMAADAVLVHPQVNTCTLSLAPAGLSAFLAKHKHEAKVLDFSKLEPEDKGTGAEATGGMEATGAGRNDGGARRGDGGGGGGGSGGGSSAPQKGDGMMNTKEGSFTDWYSEVITKAEMIEYYDVSGCYILRPWSYQIWEHIKDFLDAKFKSIGVQNCYFPIFINRTALEAEKDHVEGFAPEVAWVTRSGDGELAEPIAVRPTSETIMYPAYAKWIRSHRDLPLKLNQWNNVVRWEFKYPTPFLRSREFLWQEGHTAHATQAEAVKEVREVLQMYADVYQDLLAVPVIQGRKTEKEKFAGGDYTTTVEGYIPQAGRGIQGATSHCLGQNFGKIFKIEFEDERGQKQMPWQNSWGLTTRTIGVMVMIHGDDKGLVLPPRVAPVQVVIVPIVKKGALEELHRECRAVENELKAASIRVTSDLATHVRPGWKFNHWELRGVPLRIELGTNDVEKGQVTIARRDTGEKSEVARPTLLQKVALMLVEMQHDLLAKATKIRDDRIVKVTKWEEKMMVLTPFVNTEEWEDKVKTMSKEQSLRLAGEQGEDVRTSTSVAAKTLCIPYNQPELPEGTKCFVSGEKADCWILWGRSY